MKKNYTNHLLLILFALVTTYSFGLDRLTRDEANVNFNFGTSKHTSNTVSFDFNTPSENGKFRTLDVCGFTSSARLFVNEATSITYKFGNHNLLIAYGANFINQLSFDALPVAVCKNITVQLDASGVASIIASDLDGGSTVDSGFPSFSIGISDETYSCADIGTPRAVTLTVTDSGNQTATCDATVTVQPYVPTATVGYTITPNKTTICSNEILTFTANPKNLTNGQTALSYEWFVNGASQASWTGTTFTFGDDTGEIWTSPSDLVRVEMTVGPSSCGPIVFYEKPITVNDMLAVSFSINGPASVCEGVDAQFSISNPAVNTGTYVWKLNDSPVGGNTSNLTLNTTTNPGFTLTGPNEVTLEFTSNAACATPVTSTNSIDVTVNPVPTFTITTPGSVCANGVKSIDLNTLVSSTTSGATLTFHNNSTDANNGSGARSSTVSPTVSTTYYVRSTIPTGCFLTGSILITIDQGPAVDAGADQTICAGTPFDLSTIGSGDTGSNFIRTYYGRQNAANTGTSGISSIVSPTATTTYYVRIDNTATGCYNTDSVTINVNPLPTLTIEPGSVCNNSSIDLNTLVTTDGSKTFYATQSHANAGSPTISATVSPTAQTSYWVRTQLGTSCFKVGEIVVSVNALPTLTVVNGAVCASSQSSINLNSLVTTDGNTTVTFHATQANADTGTSAITASVSPTSQTTYYVRSKFTGGCYSTAAIIISINPLPTLVLAPASICNGNTINLNTTITSNTGTTLSYYNSQADADSGTNSISSTVSPTSTKTYYIRTVGTAGCYTVKSVVITVSDAVTIALDSGNKNQNLCAGSTPTTIKYKITNGGAGAGATVTTNPGTGITLAGSFNSTTGIYTVTVTTTTAAVIGTYNFTVTPTGCGAAGATVQTGTIRIFKNPITTLVISGPTGVCPSTTTNTYSVTDDPNILTYTWAVPSGMVINSGQGTNSIVVKVNSVGSNNSEITLQAINPCSTANSSLPVTTGTNATVNAGLDQYICAGDTSVKFDGSVGGAVIPNGNSNNKWRWISSSFNFPTNNKDHLVGGTYTLINPAVAGSTITVTMATNSNVSGCGGQLTDVMQIFVRGTPTASVTSNGPICYGSIGSVTFSGTPNTTITFKVGTAQVQTIALGAGNGATATANFDTAALTVDTDIIIQSVGYTDPKACLNAYSINDRPKATIVVNPLNTVTPGGNIYVCQSATPVDFALAGASVGSGAQGEWTIESGGGTLSPASGMTSTPATVTYKPAPNYSGDVVLRLTTNKPGQCPVVSATRTITVNQAPTVSAGTQGTICQSATPTAITLSGASVGGGNGNTTAQWSITEGGGILNPASGFSSNPQNVTYTPATNYFGQVTLKLTTNAPGACSTISDTRIFNIDQTPTVDAGLDIVQCESGIAASIPLNGASIGGGNGNTTAAWSIISGAGSLSSIDQTNDPASVTFTPNENYFGIVTLKLTSNAPGVCSSVSDTRTIEVKEAATVNAGSNIVICQGESVALNGSIGGSATSATWTIISGTGTFENADILNTIFTPTITDGTVTLKLTSNVPNGSCPAVSKTVDITVNPKATVTVNVDFDVCSADTNIPIAADLSAGSAASGNWTSSSGNSAGFASASSNVTTYTPNATDITNGSVTLTFDTNDPDSTGPCAFASDSVKITIYDAVSVSAPANIGVCASEPVSISVSASGDNPTYQWYKGTPGSGSIINNDPTMRITGETSNTLIFANTLSADAGTYYVIVKGNAACGSTGVTSSGAVLTVNQDIDITDQPDPVTACVGNTITFTVKATGTIGSYQWKKGGANFSGGTQGNVVAGNSNTITLELQNIATGDAGNYSLQLNSNGGTCDVANTTSVALTVTEIPTASISYTGSPFCNDSATARAVTLTGTNAYTGGGYSYSVVSGGPTLSLNTSTGAITPSTSSVGTYTVTYTIPASGGCPANNSITTNVTISPLPVAAIAYSAAAYCETDTNAYDVTLSGSNNTGGTYSISPTTGLTINASGQISPNGATVGNYTISYTILSANGCPDVVATVPVGIQAKPNATFSYAATNYCSNGSNPTPSITQNGGIFTAIPTGLSINASTGAINLGASTANSYTIYYTFPAVSGGCNQVQQSRTLTITPLPIASIAYSATAYCKSDTNPYAVTLSGSNNTGGAYSYVTVSGGPTLSLNTSTGVIIPNTSSVGTYTVSYTIPASGGCAIVTATTTVKIDALPVATFNYNNNTTNFCKSTGAANPLLSYTGGGVAGTFTVSPSTAPPVGLSINGSTGAINLANSGPGTYTITNTIPASAGCIQVQASQTITIFADSVGGTITGYVDNAPTLISNNIIACHSGSGVLTLTGQTGSILRWESSTDGAQNWAILPNATNPNTTNTNAFNNITLTTLFRAVLKSGPCGLKYSAIAIVNVIPPNIKPTVSPSAEQTICFPGRVDYSSQSGFGTGQLIASGGDFNDANPKDWLVDGCGNCLPANGDATQPGPWAETNGPKTFNGTAYDTNDNTKFAIVRGNVNSIMQTPVFNTLGLTTSTLTFNQAYVLTTGAQAIIELSLDGGTTYNITLQNITGAANSGNQVGLNATTIDIQNYIGQTNLKIRFRFIGNASSSWAIDNIALPKAPVGESLEWVDIYGTTLSTNTTFGYTPVTPGVNVIGVTSLINGCRSTGPGGTTFVTVKANFAWAGKPITPLAGECGETTVSLNAYDNTLTAAQNIANGAYNNNYTTGTIAGTGAGGTWSIAAAPATCSGTPTFSSLTNPRATFTGEAGTYTLRWTVAGCSSTVQVTLQECLTVDFDGVDDYATFGNSFDRTGSFSIEAWVKPNSITGTQTILSKRDGAGAANGNGYDLSLINSTISFKSNGAAAITSPYPLTIDRWYHIAVTFGNDNYNLYIDGILVKTLAGSAPTTNTLKFLLGAMDQTGNPPNKPVKHFKGWIDEVRLWNKTITQEQIRQMMNQEIKSNGANVAGEIVPLDVAGRLWADLDGYYKMNIGCGALVPTAGTVTGKLRNIYTAELQTAPLPYTSRVDGQNWTTDDTWTNFPVWDVPNSLGIDNTTRIDWNIVKTSHNIVSDSRDMTLLGLLVDSNELTITGTAGAQDETNLGTGLLITHYLKLTDLTSKIDLVGESQLVQKRYYYDDDGDTNTPEITNQISESFFDSASAGIIERDQQGTGNLWNYNYWGSPVAPGNASVDIDNWSTNTYNIAGVLRDGKTSSNPSPISWISSYDAIPGPPLQMSNRWLYKYSAVSNTYANWTYVGQSGLMNIGLGYSMKGSGADGRSLDGTTQNYVFIGKPNNGTIKNQIPAGNDVLIGNPYPSALDADEFIKDNIPLLNPDGTASQANSNSSQSTDGTLYFWEHYQSNNTHILRSYIGGYATYTLIGGQVAVLPPPTTDGVVIIGGGNGMRKPERYVPVSQGFFVTASPTGGDITFKNSQRVFKREAFTGAANNGSLFFRTAGTMADADTNSDEALIKRIRLQFNTPEGAVRPLLLGFTPDNAATDGADYGYDALNNDNFPSDLSWLIDGNEYVIQGVGAFENTKQYPFAMKLAINGEIKISLTDLENFDEAIDVYIYDSLLDTYHQINTTDFTMTLAAGNYDNRFFITFIDDEALTIDESNVESVYVNYLTDTDEIYIKPPTGVRVKQIYLINLIGQTVKSWNMTNIAISNEIRIPVKDVSEGTYVIKVQTDGATLNKKVIIKY